MKCSSPATSSSCCRQSSRATGVSKWKNPDRLGESTKTTRIESNSTNLKRKYSPVTTRTPWTWWLLKTDDSIIFFLFLYLVYFLIKCFVPIYTTSISLCAPCRCTHVKISVEMSLIFSKSIFKILSNSRRDHSQFWNCRRFAFFGKKNVCILYPSI